MMDINLTGSGNLFSTDIGVKVRELSAKKKHTVTKR
jgi:hypothetical protein